MTWGLQDDLFAFYLQKAGLTYNVQGIVLSALQARVYREVTLPQ